MYTNPATHLGTLGNWYDHTAHKHRHRDTGRPHSRRQHTTALTTRTALRALNHGQKLGDVMNPVYSAFHFAFLKGAGMLALRLSRRCRNAF